MFEYNKDYEKRDQLIFGKKLDWTGERVNAVEYFKELDLTTLKALLTEVFIDPDETQNDSPSTQDYLEMMEKYPAITAHGYVVSPYRDDYRITLDGIRGNHLCQEAMQEALDMCREACDLDFDLATGYIWAGWD